MMRAGLCVVAILCAFIIGRYTVPEPPIRELVVKERVYIRLAEPPPKPVVKRRATLEGVRQEWGISGRLSCAAVPR